MSDQIKKKYVYDVCLILVGTVPCLATVPVLTSVSNSGGFVKLRHMNISHALFSNHPGSEENWHPSLTPVHHSC